MAQRPSNERQLGESPRAYAKRMREEEELARIIENERQQLLKHEKMEQCTHYGCEPIEWHWNGKPRVMHCRDCDATNYLEDGEE